MIFRLKENYSKEDLQKSYKKLVKKYHPDSNPKNQDWSHKKMTEINLAYEICCKHLESKTKINQEFPENRPKKEDINKKSGDYDKFSTINERQKSRNLNISSELYSKMTNVSTIFIRGAEKYFEYGLEKRKMRYEGVRRFRYRESLRDFNQSMEKSFELEEFCRQEYDRFALNLFIRFTGNFIQYIQLRESDIPDHPLINSHWDSMEDYLLLSIKSYLVPHLMHNYRKTSWNTSFTHCWNQLMYLKQRFPVLAEDTTFLIFQNLADSFLKLRNEEYDRQMHFFLQ